MSKFARSLTCLLSGGDVAVGVAGPLAGACPPAPCCWNRTDLTAASVELLLPDDAAAVTSAAGEEEEEDEDDEGEEDGEEDDCEDEEAVPMLPQPNAKLQAL